jgi:hypothetical protein
VGQGSPGTEPLWVRVPQTQFAAPGRTERLPEISGHIWRGPEKQLGKCPTRGAIFGKVIVQRALIA